MKKGKLQNSIDLAKFISETAGDVKGQDIKVLDVSEVFNLSDYFILISGRSDRHVQGICNKIIYELENIYKLKPLSIEGLDKAHWVLIDYGDVIVHTFYKQEREHYDIESLWRDAKIVDFKESKNKDDDDLEAA